MSLSTNSTGLSRSSSVSGSRRRVQRLHGGPHGAGALLERDPVAGTQRAVGEPADGCVQFAGLHGQDRRRHRPLTKTSPRPTSMSSASSIETDSGATAVVRESSRVSTAVTVDRVPAGRLMTGSPTCRVPAGEPAGVAAALLGGRPGHPLHRQPQPGRLRLRRRQLDVLQVLEQGRARRTTACGRTGAPRCRRVWRRSGSPSRRCRRVGPRPDAARSSTSS